MTSYSPPPPVPASLQSSPPLVNTHMANFSQKEIKEWELRSDVLYHFHAYRYFSQTYPDTSIDLVNLDDADVQYYNRTSDMVRGLSISHKLAAYLSSFSLKHPVESADTHRKRLLCHVREYNLRADPRRRFYMLGLSEEEAKFLKSLPPIPRLRLFSSSSTKSAGAAFDLGDVKEGTKDDSEVGVNAIEKSEDGTSMITSPTRTIFRGVFVDAPLPISPLAGDATHEAKQLVWATDACLDTNFRSQEELKKQEDKVEQLIEDSLAKYRERRDSGELVPGVEQNISALKLT